MGWANELSKTGPGSASSEPGSFIKSRVLKMNPTSISVSFKDTVRSFQIDNLGVYDLDIVLAEIKIPLQVFIFTDRSVRIWAGTSSENEKGRLTSLVVAHYDSKTTSSYSTILLANYSSECMEYMLAVSKRLSFKYQCPIFLSLPPELFITPGIKPVQIECGIKMALGHALARFRSHE